MQVVDELGPVSKKVEIECVNRDGGTGTRVPQVRSLGM